jgi:hypothetical protein
MAEWTESQAKRKGEKQSPHVCGCPGLISSIHFVQFAFEIWCIYFAKEKNTDIYITIP